MHHECMAASAGRRTRPLRPEELLDRFAGSLRSLVLHCQRFNDEVVRVIAEHASEPPTSAPLYDPAPSCDIAAQLRKLLGERDGDDLLRRVCESSGVPVPRIQLTRDATTPSTPWDKVAVEHFAMGAVPLDDGAGEAVLVTEVGGRVCLALLEPGEEMVLLTWGELIKQVANKDGVHLDERRPIVWDFINAHHIGLVPGIPFLLYRLALAVVEAGNEILSSVGRAAVEMDLSHSLGGMRCYAMVATRTTKRPGPRPGRNERCPCSSGKKFKHCCG